MSRSGKRFGVELHQYLDAPSVIEEAQLAARLGYDSVWFGDSQMIWRDIYVIMGAVAATTSEVMLGTGVTNPVTRHPSVTASALVTLQELTGNRVLAGVGVGDSSLMTLGKKRVTRAGLDRFISTLRALCEGESVEGPAGEIRLSFGAPGRCPPILIAGAGPKMLRLAGEVSDGAIVTGIGAPSVGLDGMLASIQAGLQENDRDVKGFAYYMAVAASVHRDRSRAMAAVRPHVARSLLTYMWPMSDTTRRVQEQLKASYDYHEHMSPSAHHREVIPDEVVDEFAIAGTREDCVERCKALFDAGFDEITIRPYGVDGSSRINMVEIFAREVIAPYRRSLS